MDIAPLLNASLLLKLHIAASSAAIVLGALQFLRKKGTKPHKVIGWAWVILMVFVAISAIFLPHRSQLNSILPWVLTVWVVVALPLSIIAIKNGKVMLHRAFMLGLYVGGLIIAFSFTFTPGRLLYKVIFG